MVISKETGLDFCTCTYPTCTLHHSTHFTPFLPPSVSASAVFFTLTLPLSSSFSLLLFNQRIASLHLIGSEAVFLFLPWPGPLILQLAPVGIFQPQPLFFSTLNSGPRCCIAPQNIMMQSSVLIEERGVIKAGLILLRQKHNTWHSCRGDE